MISIHAPRTGSDAQRIDNAIKLGISIHAPRTGSDAAVGVRVKVLLDFNPRSPHGERPGRDTAGRDRRMISIHAPRTGSDDEQLRKELDQQISIHAPRTGSDICSGVASGVPHKFQSTLPARGATAPFTIFWINSLFIPIPAPLTGSDISGVMPACCATYFNPRSPHGERPSYCFMVISRLLLFQSTLPARGATPCPQGHSPGRAISIHAPRTGSDRPVRRDRPRR